MALFEKFVDTVFVKMSNSLVNQIEELNAIKDKVVEKEKIEKDIKLLEYGLKGEREIAFELQNANLGMYVLNDVTIDCDGLKAQIDYVIITRGYTYLVECKNMFGDIIIDDKGEFRREYRYDGKTIKEGIYSPYTQAQRHKDIVMKRWYKKNGKISTFLFEKTVNNNYKPLIVLANSKGLLKMNYAPKEIKNCTVRVDQLINYIKNDLDKYDRDLLSSRKHMEELAQSFLDATINNIVSLKDRYTMKIDNKEELINNLKEFRKKKSTKKNIPAYYIFTDEELMNIINANIRTFSELKASKLLPDVKLKLHGNDIINVINKVIDRERKD